MKQTQVVGIAIAVVSAVAAVQSFEHMRELSEWAGEEWRSWLTPLSVDGLLLASSLVARQAKVNGHKVPRLTFLSIAVGILVSVAANILSSVPPQDLPLWLPAVLAAWPPLALALAFEEALTLRAISAAKSEPETASSEDSSPAGLDVADVAAAHAAPVPVVPEIVPEPAADLAANADLADSDAREAARALIRSGVALSGKALGERFGKSERWGRMQISAVVQEQQSAKLAVVR